MFKMAASTRKLCGTLFSTLEDETFRKRAYPGLLGILDDHQLFSSATSYTHDFVSHIHNTLHSADSRWEGVSLLSVYINQCSSSQFTEHCNAWVRLLLNVLQSHDAAEVINFACEVLSDLLGVAVGFSEIARELSHQIAVIIKWVISATPACLPGALTLVTSCVRHFPGSSGPFKSKVENFVLGIWQESTNPNITETACHVFSMLPRVGGGGSKGIKHIEAWDIHMNRILGSSHNAISQLYQDIETGVETHSIPKETLPLALPEETEPRRTFQLANQFQTLCRCLRYQISGDFPATVHMPIDAILTLVCRTLAINCQILANKTTTEFMLLSNFIPKLHTAALRVLDTLIKRCGSHMIPHGPIINKVLIQTLGWTNSSTASVNSGQQLPYASLKSECYTVLHTWLSSVGAASCIDSNTDKLIEFLLADIKPRQENIQLITSKTPEFESSKKKRRKHKGFETADQLLGQQKTNCLANQEVTYAALKGLTAFIQVQGTRLKPGVHRDIHTVVVPLLLAIQQNPTNPPIPYSCPKSRQQLYRLLLACILVPHPRWPPPLQCSIKIFSVGLQDASLEVSTVCRESQIICNSVIHPRVPSLNTSLPQADLSDHVTRQNRSVNFSLPYEKVTASAVGSSVAMSTVVKGIAMDSEEDSGLTSEKSTNMTKSETPRKNLTDIPRETVIDQGPQDKGTSSNERKDAPVAKETEEKESEKDAGDSSSSSDDDGDQNEEENKEKEERSESDSDRGVKRKTDNSRSEDDVDEEHAKKKKVDDLASDAMIESFVDSLPDSD